ncbi:hypothetical protein ACFQVD_26660 [Streptosporangium amethystogenes subsp. fukuiense]|uniref:Uncharacterized protein n=1 Tax=Streptosporangium amethystogenes subsp. fukuiense TaxID=698418 RepID=A0ABW2T631_9ACTN
MTASAAPTTGPVEIIAEIARLSALLPAAITEGNQDGTWDGDVAALLGHFAAAQHDQAAALNEIADMEMEDEDWDTVVYETVRSAAALGATAFNLTAAQGAAQSVQDSIAAAIETARVSRFSHIFTETRPSNVFAKLAKLDGALTTR